MGQIVYGERDKEVGFWQILGGVVLYLAHHSFLTSQRSLLPGRDPQTFLAKEALAYLHSKPESSDGILCAEVWLDT